MAKDQSEPQGEMILRTLAMPADTNPNGDIFGGWVMAQMDIAGGILSKEVARGRTVTIAVEGMKFIKPVHVGDVVCCYGLVDSIGNTSIALKTRGVGQACFAERRRRTLQGHGRAVCLRGHR
jgi:acyl-CoA thioesterase YciA